MRRIVDLPQPDGPTRTMNSPSPISSETLLTAITSLPNTLLTRSRTILAMGHRSFRRARVCVPRRSWVKERRTRACAAFGAPDAVQSHHGGAGDRRRGQHAHLGRGRHLAEPRADAVEERVIAVAEDPAAEHDVDVQASASAGGGSRSRPSTRPRRPGGRRPRGRRRRRRSRHVEQDAAPPPPAAARRSGRSRWPPSAAAVASGRSARAPLAPARSSCRGRLRIAPRATSRACRVAAASPVARDRPDRGEPRDPAVRATPRSSSCRSRTRRRPPTDDRCPRAAPRTCRCAARRREVHPFDREPSEHLRSSAGRSAPARQKTPRSATGRRSGSMPASCASAIATPHRHQVALLTCCWIRHVLLSKSAAEHPSGAEHGAVAREAGPTSLFEPPPSTARMAGALVTAGRPARRSTRRTRRCSRRPAIDGADAFAGPPGPRVQEHDGAVAMRAHAFDRVVRDQSSRCATPPSPPARRANARCDSRARRSDRQDAVSSSCPAPNGKRNHGRGSAPVIGLDRPACASSTSLPHAVVVQERHPSMVVRVVPDQMALVGDPLGRSSAATPPIVPARRTSLAHLSSPQHVEDVLGVASGGHHGTVRVLGVERQRHPKEGSPSLTRRHLRCADGTSPGGRPRSTASLHASSCAGRMETAGASGRSCAPMSIRITPAGVSRAVDDGERGARPAPPARPRAPTSRSRVSGSVAITMAARSGPASSSGPWRNWAVCERLDRHARPLPSA